LVQTRSNLSKVIYNTNLTKNFGIELNMYREVHLKLMKPETLQIFIS